MRGQNVTLPGGQDKDGHPIILITIPQDSPPLDIVPSLTYILSIFRYALLHTYWFNGTYLRKGDEVDKLSSYFLSLR